MAWEQRGSVKYYYRSVRSGRKVQKEYLGKGPKAELEAAKDALVQEKRKAARKLVAQLKEETSKVDQLMRELEAGERLLRQAVLYGAGYHQHRGHWRKRREQTR